MGSTDNIPVDPAAEKNCAGRVRRGAVARGCAMYTYAALPGALEDGGRARETIVRNEVQLAKMFTQVFANAPPVLKSLFWDDVIKRKVKSHLKYLA